MHCKLFDKTSTREVRALRQNLNCLQIFKFFNNFHMIPQNQRRKLQFHMLYIFFPKFTNNKIYIKLKKQQHSTNNCSPTEISYENIECHFLRVYLQILLILNA